MTLTILLLTHVCLLIDWEAHIHVNIVWGSPEIVERSCGRICLNHDEDLLQAFEFC